MAPSTKALLAVVLLLGVSAKPLPRTLDSTSTSNSMAVSAYSAAAAPTTASNITPVSSASSTTAPVSAESDSASTDSAQGNESYDFNNNEEEKGPASPDAGAEDVSTDESGDGDQDANSSPDYSDNADGGESGPTPQGEESTGDSQTNGEAQDDSDDTESGDSGDADDSDGQEYDSQSAGQRAATSPSNGNDDGDDGFVVFTPQHTGNNYQHRPSEPQNEKRTVQMTRRRPFLGLKRDPWALWAKRDMEPSNSTSSTSTPPDPSSANTTASASSSSDSTVASTPTDDGEDDDDLFGIFDQADWVTKERRIVANKYKNAMKFIAGVRAGSVQLSQAPDEVPLDQPAPSAAAVPMPLSGLRKGNTTVDYGNARVSTASTMTASSAAMTAATASPASESSAATDSAGASAENVPATSTKTSPVDSAPTPSFTAESQTKAEDPSEIATDMNPLQPRGGSNLNPLTDYMTGQMDVLYYGDLSIGTPAQKLTVDFDTGSGDLWVPMGCSNCRSTEFDKTKSHTFKDTGKNFAVSYGSGDVSGRLVQDTVSIAGTTVKQQYFGGVSKESDEFVNNPNSGVIGMGFGSLSTSGKSTYFENLLTSKTITNPYFGVHLARHSQTGSSICLGCYDSNKMKGRVTWIPIIDKSYWCLAMTGFTASGGKRNALDSSMVAAIDTGTSLIYVSKAAAKAFYAQIPGSKPATQFGDGFYQFPCTSKVDVRVGLDDNYYSVQVKDFNLGKTSSRSKDCIGGVLSMDDGFPSNLAIVGDAFLKSWYSIYDYTGDARVGLAPSVNN